MSLPAFSRLLARPMLNKVPEITVFFWIIKVLCTTVGETFADDLTINAGLGDNTLYLVGLLTVVALAVQFSVRRYIAPVYWRRRSHQRFRHANY